MSVLGDGLFLLSSQTLNLADAASFLYPQLLEPRFLSFSLGAWATAGFLVTLALGLVFQQAATAWVIRAFFPWAVWLKRGT